MVSCVIFFRFRSPFWRLMGNRSLNPQLSLDTWRRSMDSLEATKLRKVSLLSEKNRCKGTDLIHACQLKLMHVWSTFVTSATHMEKFVVFLMLKRKRLPSTSGSLRICPRWTRTFLVLSTYNPLTYVLNRSQWLGKLEKSLVGSSGFAVGSKISAADLTIYYFLTFFFDDKVSFSLEFRQFSLLKSCLCQERATAAYASLPKIKAIVAAVAAHEGVKAWEAKRPVTPF